MDSLIGVLFTFMLGFSMNFLPTASRFGRGAAYFGAALALAGADAMAAELNEVYWTGHWILVVWTPMVALAIALLVL